jgi:hypothetical protein
VLDLHLWEEDGKITIRTKKKKKQQLKAALVEVAKLENIAMKLTIGLDEASLDPRKL